MVQEMTVQDSGGDSDVRDDGQNWHGTKLGGDSDARGGSERQ